MTTPEIQEIIVPPINQRDRIPQAAIDDVVKQIVEKFKPIKIILFGSYAYGKPTQVSDVDLLVIMESSLKERQLSERQLSQKIRTSINYQFGLDLIIKTPESLSNRIEMGDFFLKEVMQKGKILYEQNTG